MAPVTSSPKWRYLCPQCQHSYSRREYVRRHFLVTHRDKEVPENIVRVEESASGRSELVPWKREPSTYTYSHDASGSSNSEPHSRNEPTFLSESSVMKESPKSLRAAVPAATSTPPRLLPANIDASFDEDIARLKATIGYQQSLISRLAASLDGAYNENHRINNILASVKDLVNA